MNKEMRAKIPWRRMSGPALRWLSLWACVSSVSAWAGIVTNIQVIDFAFDPPAVTVNVNDTVQWSWSSTFLHSTTDAGLWDSGLHSGSTFTFTNQFTSAGTFPYICTLHLFSGTVTVNGPNSPPTVTITNPPDGAVYSAPATFALEAAAADIDGNLTNVEFFQGTSLLGSVANMPFSVPVNNLAAGDFRFSAVATDSGGLSATNAVTVHVITPGPIRATSPRWQPPASFQFTYSANAGLRYVVQRSVDFTNWTALATNTAGSSSEVFLDTNASASPGFYRIGLLRNP
jgi:plastocyanin